jgi:hypothetical protein
MTTDTNPLSFLVTMNSFIVTKWSPKKDLLRAALLLPFGAMASAAMLAYMIKYAANLELRTARPPVMSV